MAEIWPSKIIHKYYNAGKHTVKTRSTVSLMDTIPNKSQCYFFYRRAYHRADFEYLQSVTETNLFFGDRNFV